MKKFLLFALLLIAIVVIVYLTFVIAKLKIQIGLILLAISAIFFFVAWAMWKTKK